ncbi:uncharacterized protein IUM83_08296 [Phytophthora cinnamomi]|uniref:uncharacterized protein n=1 Tax=Phytophthora cinnamomi TaxID=4785 RepID=UPI003559BEDA|nr:hypothetical protein IUM83_08296 [Phytophthora cinnamomi]
MQASANGYVPMDDGAQELEGGQQEPPDTHQVGDAPQQPGYHAWLHENRLLVTFVVVATLVAAALAVIWTDNGNLAKDLRDALSVLLSVAEVLLGAIIQRQ